ncbi:MAG TPA: hypothetical protein VKE74_08945 [Gemmataceae bacterium]|nr:hypothetical protein [Gemmataceae bacterium]
MGAVIFVPALAGAVISGFVFALFAAHHYLTVLQSTGSGAKQVTWVSEPILDHFWKVFYLAWLIGLLLGPGYLLGRFLTAGSESVWLKVAVPLAVFWIAYPISQLSSLSGPTIWLPLHPEVFGRLARKPGVVLGFMGLSGLALAGIGAGFRLAFFTDGLIWLVIGSVLFVVSGLFYARLLGRLAFVLAFTRPFMTRKKKGGSAKRDQSDGAGQGGTLESGSDPGFAQPSDLPPIDTPNEGPLTGYDLKTAEVPEKPRKRVVAEAVEEAEPVPRPERRKPAERSVDPARQWTEEDEDASPYGVTAAEVMPEEVAPTEVVRPTEAEMRLISRDDAPRRPKRAWTAELFVFLGQPETVAAILMLSGMCAVVGGMVRIARAFNPAVEGL